LEEIALGDEKGLGPTDYQSYMFIKVDPAAIDKWTALLKPDELPPITPFPSAATLGRLMLNASRPLFF
jgi:hypothetical protein